MNLRPTEHDAPGGSEAATAQPESRHCYHCGTRHDASEMRRVMTSAGVRWRCLKSIAAARQPRAVRECMGQARTAANRAENRRRAEYMNLFRRQIA